MVIASDPEPSALRENSYAVVRGLFDGATTERLREICERVLAQWRQNPRCDNPPVGPQSNYLRHLNDPEYHRDHPQDLAFLLSMTGAPQLVAAARAALGEDFLFAMSSLYFNPSGVSEAGFWHKDKIGDQAVHVQIPATGAGLQIQIALVPSEDLELVPASHLRDYTPAEYGICIADDECNNRSNEMPGAVRVELEPGDAVLFTQLCIHRGRYHADKLRRTLMVSVTKRLTAEHNIRQRGLNYGSDQPWFLLPDYLDNVEPEARAFFGEFVDFYAPHWRQKLTEVLKYSSLLRALAESGAPNPFFADQHRGADA